VKPQFVFIRFELPADGRKRIPNQPAIDRRRKGTDNFLHQRVKRATKPLPRKRKAHGLMLLQLIREEVAPPLPEVVIVSFAFQEPGEFIDVGQSDIPAKHVAQGVQ
jgi:hypothetical protein